MTAWEIFDRNLSERADKRKRELGLSGDTIATALEEVRDAAHSAFAEASADWIHEKREEGMGAPS
jgi:hypothetical protein